MKADVIVMPRMEVRAMISRSGVLTAETKRRLLVWKHAAFIDRLAIKCHDVEFDERYPDKDFCVLLVQPEGYTSKTCGKCGVRKENMGGTKVFVCSSAHCDYRAGRDHNGARNMLIKALHPGHLR